MIRDIRSVCYPLKLALNRKDLNLVLIALGIVFSDIGTSVLYAVNELFFGSANVAQNPESIIGVISLLIWTLTLITSFKYMLLVLRADNRGEGGPFALMGLLRRHAVPGTSILIIILLGSASLLFAESILTPAISVMAAIEGLRHVTSTLVPYSVHISIVILLALFAFQRRGTAGVGKCFGPIALIWFVFITSLGLAWIVEEPQILWAFNPWYAVMFVASVSGGMQLAILLGVIVLVITGGEAPFADLGHVGRRAIRIGWFAVVYPALLLNYLGQGAYVLSGSAVRDGNVFFSMVPDWLAIPAVLIATAAAVIASQALISGDFSLGSQAIARGMAPRLFIRHTSDQKEGQIYIPSVNWALCIGCVLLVLWFESPSRLVSAYGLAVSGVMLGTSIVMIAVSRYVWKWSWFLAIGIFGTFSIIDILFFGANMLKFLHGAFVPICIGIVLFVMMQTWRWGSAVRRAAHRAYTDGRDIAWLVDLKRRLRESNGCLHDPPRRDLKELDEVMIVMASQPVQELTDHVPITERTFQKRFHAIPRELVFLTVIREHQATIPDDERISVIHFPEHITSVLARFGFLEKPSLHPFLERIKTECKLGLQDHRCVFASGNDVFIIAEKPSERPSALDRIRLSLYQLQLWFTLDGPRSLGIDTEPGLTRVSIPIRIDCNGWRVEIPESALETSEEKIDPDTRQPSETKSVKPDEVDPNETETEPKMTKVPEKLQPPDTSELPM